MQKSRHMSNIDERLEAIGGTRVKTDVPLSRYTTWKVGGNARFLVFAENARSVRQLIEFTVEEGLPLLILGNGSNILVSDEGFPGVCLRLRGELASVVANRNTIESGAGALLSSMVTVALRSELAGIEFFFGIPGTVGGAVMTNAGAFGHSMSDVLGRVVTIDKKGEERTYGDFEARYRTALVPEGEVVLEATFPLSAGKGEEIKKRMLQYREERKASQPWGMSTAGSVFKNPPGDTAGRLIDECGLKGASIGGAKISEIHANFIINTGKASAADIKSLVDLMKSEVAERFDVVLQPEIHIIGFEEE